MKKGILGMVVAITIVSSLVSCGKSEQSSETTADTSAAETTTVTTVVTEATVPEVAGETTTTVESGNVGTTEAEATTVGSTTEASVTEEPASTVTTAPQNFDDQLDSMMSSIEAEIPDITAFTGFDFDKDKKPVTSSDSSEATTTTKSATTTTTTTTVASTEPTVKLAEPTSPQEFIFDNKRYNNAEFTSNGVDKPANWVPTPGATTPQFENSAYPMSYIIEHPSKGATFTIAPAKKDGKSPYASVQFYKGITWGSKEADILSAYGEPIHKGSFEQYNTTLTSLYYRDSSGATIIYEVSKDWGLVAVDCNGV